MFKVRNAEEAMILAKELCQRHGAIIKGIGSSQTARDAALRILLSEIQAGEPVAKGVASRPLAVGVPVGSSSGQNTTTPQKLSAIKPQSRNNNNASEVPKVDYSAMRKCTYCNEPTSRYCKETGRRHGSSEERALLRWKAIYRQLANASHFVSTARLSKPNTCVEDYAVQLDL